MRTKLLLIGVVTIFMITGCLVSDQITTITVQPNGSADWVKFQSNVHSTIQGPKGVDELKQFVEEFESHRDSDYIKITESGGEVVEARWVRREEPYANLVVARFPHWTAFQSFATLKGDKGEVIAQPQFTENGNRRKLSLSIPLPPGEKPAEEAKPTIEQLRQEQANNLSETRVVVVAGRIVASRGFVVASDQRSALVDPSAIHEMLESGPQQLELFLEWELDQ